MAKKQAKKNDPPKAPPPEEPKVDETNQDAPDAPDAPDQEPEVEETKAPEPTPEKVIEQVRNRVRLNASDSIREVLYSARYRNGLCARFGIEADEAERVIDEVCKPILDKLG